MESAFTTQSLLPWLEAGAAKLHLRLSLPSEAESHHSTPALPFRFLDSSSPLFHLVHACYAHPEGKSEKDIFLLVQKDQYSFSEKNIPFDNKAIDVLWQEALIAAGAGAAGIDTTSFGSASLGSLGQDLLLGAPGSSGAHGVSGLPLWRSLFYCQKRACFFHPPCPQCGCLLELCCDDEILRKAELPAYSSTMERYLYCPVCSDSGESPEGMGPRFYSSHDAHSGISVVKDCLSLIEAFGEIVRSGEELQKDSSFPCFNCPEKNNCYDAGQVVSRVAPFAFYPFRMLLVDGAQAGAEEFVSLLSGATVEELRKEPKMIASPGKAALLSDLQEQGTEEVKLFFTDDARRFLEILYLKLAFLQQVSGTLFAAGKYQKHSDLKLSLDQFWVDFSEHKGLLPTFWDFRVKAVGIGIYPGTENSFLKVPSSFGLYSLALTWFSTLLGNRKQSAADIQNGLAKWIESDQEVESAEVFSPANIFYHPEKGLSQQELPVSWFDCWQQSLLLGFSLLRASLQQPDFSVDDFTQKLTLLAEDVKKQLFASVDQPLVLPEQEVRQVIEPPAPELKPEPEKVESSSVAGDSEILNILLGLKEKWKEETRAEEAVEVQKSDVAEEDAGVTKVMRERVEDDDAFLDEATVVIRKKQPPAPEIEPEPEAAPELEETIIATPGMRTDLGGKTGERGEVKPDKQAFVAPEPATAQEPEPVSSDDDLEKTVLLSADQLAAMMAGEEPAKPAPPPEPSPEENAAVSAGVGKQGMVEVPESNPEEDLEKTVIMNLNDLSSMLAEENPSSLPVSEPEVKPQAPASPAKESVVEDLSETVIISVEELEKLKKGKNGNK